MNNEFASPELPPEEPTLLPVLIVLSYINTILAIVIYVLMLLFAFMVRGLPHDEFQARIDEAMEQFQGQEEALLMIGQYMEIFYASGILWAFLLLARSIARLVGVILMHRRRMMGFHVYVGAQVLGLFAPLIILPWEMFGIFGALMVALMIGLYGSQRKWLTVGQEFPKAY